MVGINVPIPVPVSYHSFGGWKRSGFGDTGQHGMEGVRFWTKNKAVTQRWPDGTGDGTTRSLHHPDNGVTRLASTASALYRQRPSLRRCAITVILMAVAACGAAQWTRSPNRANNVGRAIAGGGNARRLEPRRARRRATAAGQAPQATRASVELRSTSRPALAGPLGTRRRADCTSATRRRQGAAGHQRAASCASTNCARRAEHAGRADATADSFSRQFRLYRRGAERGPNVEALQNFRGELCVPKRNRHERWTETDVARVAPMRCSSGC